MQDRHRQIFQMTRLFIFVWSVTEENSPPLGGRVLCFPPGEDTRKGGGWGQGRGEGDCGIVSGGSGGSLYQPDSALLLFVHQLKVRAAAQRPVSIFPR